jgi:hypothetical protein
MREQDINRATLAKRVGVTHGAITRFFSEDQASSVLVPKIFAELGLPFSAPDEQDEMQQLLTSLTDKQRDAVLRFLREIVDARQTK